MSLTEDTEILALFGDNVSLWGPPHDEEASLHLSTNSTHLKEKGVDLDTFDPLTPESDVSGDDPMPDWMSEKVALSAWLGDEEDIPMAEMMTIPSSPIVKATPPTSSAEDLLKQLLEDIGVPATLNPGGDIGARIALTPGEDIVSSPLASPCPDQSSGDLLALSPTSPLGSESSVFVGSSPVSPEQIMTDISEQSVLGNMSAEGDLEAQALALLDILSGTTTGVDTSMINTEVITINLPPLSSSSEDQSRASIISEAQSLANVFSEVNSPAPLSPESSFPASPESYSPTSPESISKPPTPGPSPVQKRSRTKPRLKNASPIDRKSRKRTQNKEAATRYRLKKRAEAGIVSSELSSLQTTNKALKDKVEGLSKEIQYLKDLLLEVRQLKGQINTIQTD